MDREENQSIVSLARECSASISGLVDDARSVYSETTANINVMFDFDTLILRSKIYQQAQRSHLRQAIRARNGDRDNLSMAMNEDNDTITDALIVEHNATQDTSSRSEITFNRESENNRAGLARATGQVRDEGSPRQPTTPSSASKDAQDNLNAPLAPEPAPAVKSPRQIPAIRWNNWLKKAPRRKDSITSPAAFAPPRKILILGTSESGKSTLLKALHVSLKKYSLADRLSFREIIWSNVVQSTRVVLEAMESLELPLEDQRAEYHVQTIFMQPAQCDWEDLDDSSWPTDVLKAILVLWLDSGFQHAYKRRRQYQLPDSFRYYATHAERICSPDYVPTDEDMLRSRVKTTGITETTFSYNYLDYAVLDVGGVRSERKKWIYGFQNVSTVVFTIDAECYAKLLFEDETVNRMQEQLTLFDSIANSRWFSKSNFLVIFTKMDLVEECLQEVPVENFFPDYSRNMLLPPTQSYMRYVEKRFMELIESDATRQRTKVIRTNLVEDVREEGLQIWDMLDRIERSGIP